MFEAYIRGHDFIQEDYTTVRPAEQDKDGNKYMNFDDNYFSYFQVIVSCLENSLIICDKISKIKKDQVENHIITRNKTNQYKESILGNISSVTNHKNKNLGFDFQIENGEDGTYEKLII